MHEDAEIKKEGNEQMKFTEKLRTTTETYVVKIRAKDKELADHQKNGIETYSYEKYKEMLLEMQEQKDALLREGLAEVQALITEYKANLPRRFAAVGSDLDAGDMALLSSGYKLTAADLETMFDRHSPNNHTMLRAILDYTETHEIHINRIYYGEKEKAEAADLLRTYASNCFYRPDYGMESEAYFDQICPDALAGD